MMADGAGTHETLTAAQIAAALRVSPRAVRMRAASEGWPSQTRTGIGGKALVYPLTTLPEDVRAAITLQRERARPAPAAKPGPAARVASAWERYQIAGEDLQARAQRSAAAVAAVAALVDAGSAVMAARQQVAAQLHRDGVGVSVATLGRWAKEVAGIDRADWPAVLLPAYVGGNARAHCDAQAWDWYKGHYLTRGRPSHGDTYRRLRQMAKTHGWTIPSAKTLSRRMDEEVPHTSQVIAREGVEAGRKLLPTLQRDALSYAVGEAVNGDGLKLDSIWVRFEDGEVINSATIWAWQDVNSRKLVAWRLAKTENTDLFRLATYDLTGVCAPSAVWIDNTRVAANKLMTAGARGRHRFKSDPEDGQGLLLMLGMEPHFTNPSKEHGNPGAKPIERAFGIGGLHDMIRTNPRLQALDCYRKANAVDVAVLREVIAEEVARFNAQTGRRTQACRGVLSFDQAWDEGRSKQAAPRTLSDAQRRILLMSREVVRADRKNGELRIEAGRGPFGRNAYWCEHLPQYAGRKLAVHFDPEDLRADAHVYTLDGRYLFAAQNMARGAFATTDAGREHAKFRRRIAKLNKERAQNESRLSALERAALYEGTAPTPAPAAPTDDTNVVRPHFARVPDPARDALAATGTDDARESALADFLAAAAERRARESL